MNNLYGLIHYLLLLKKKKMNEEPDLFSASRENPAESRRRRKLTFGRDGGRI